MAFLGIDIGTSGCKAVIFDENWNVVSEAYKEYSMLSYGECNIELDPEMIWQKTKEAIIQANKNLQSGKVTALAVSAIGDVIIPLGKNLKPVRPSIVDFDIRGKEEIFEFASDFGISELFQITGMPPLFINSLAKILYIKKHEPFNYEKVVKWATYEDYILAKMGAGLFVSYSLAARTMLFDIREKKWSNKILDILQISKDNLPEPVESAKIIGILDSKISDELGFKGEVKVCSGGHDMVCAAIGAGLDLRNPQIAVDINGTIEGIITAFKEANTNQIMLDNLYPCYPGYKGYVSFSVNLTSGCVIKWHMDNIANEIAADAKNKQLDAFNEVRKKIDPNNLSNLIYIPHFSGSGTPYFNTNSKGCIYGLTLNTNQSDLIKGLYEGLCYEIRYQLDAFREAGINIEKLIAVGKGAKSNEWLQLKANITGRQFTNTPVADASSLGAAAFSAAASGFLDDPTDAARSINRKSIIFEPDRKVKEEADQKYLKYKNFFENLNILENSF